MNIPKVTAIIATHNRNDLVGRAIESVLNQTYTNLDCIVVDDASDISAEDVCKKYPVKFIYIPKEKSMGGNHARNVGIYSTDAEYIAFLDDDDFWLPNKIEKQVKLIEEKHCELVYSGARAEFVSGDSIAEGTYTPDFWKQGDMSKRILLEICCLNITILANRQALLQCGLFDEKVRYWQEYELTIRLAQRTPFYFVPEVLAVFRVDTSDKRRLTNNYHKWLQSVEYIYSKHKELYETLTVMEKMWVKHSFYADAIARAKSSGHKYLALYYKILLKTLFIPVKFYIRCCKR